MLHVWSNIKSNVIRIFNFLRFWLQRILHQKSLTVSDLIIEKTCIKSFKTGYTHKTAKNPIIYTQRSIRWSLTKASRALDIIRCDNLESDRIRDLQVPVVQPRVLRAIAPLSILRYAIIDPTCFFPRGNRLLTDGGWIILHPTSRGEKGQPDTYQHEFRNVSGMIISPRFRGLSVFLFLS